MNGDLTAAHCRLLYKGEATLVRQETKGSLIVTINLEFTACARSGFIIISLRTLICIPLVLNIVTIRSYI